MPRAGAGSVQDELDALPVVVQTGEPERPGERPEREVVAFLQKLLDLRGGFVSERRGGDRLRRGEVRDDVPVAPTRQPAVEIPGRRIGVLDGAAECFPLVMRDPEQLLAGDRHDWAETSSSGCSTVTSSPARTAPGTTTF